MAAERSNLRRRPAEQLKMPPNQKTLRARVFISCGQSKDTDEEAIAHAIREKLERLGFEAFVAVEEQTLKGIKDRIFEQLRNSEYFIFVDFRRERLGRTVNHRGSLFSHQELALASYLDLDVLAFQESGVKLDGLLSFIGGNANRAPFQFEGADRSKLPAKIANEVRKRARTGKWNQNWRNEIVIDPDTEPTPHDDRPGGQPSKFFGITVRNRHCHKTATNCFVYLERATRLDDSTENPIPLHTFELKWEGFLLPNANILPAQARRFDAFHIPHACPTKVQFSTMFSDWSGLFPPIETEGRYRLEYMVLSDSFPPARGSFILNLASQLDLTTFVHAP